MAQIDYKASNGVSATLASSHQIFISTEKEDGTNDVELEKYNFKDGKFTLKNNLTVAIGDTKIFEVYDCSIPGLNGWYVCDKAAANTKELKISDNYDTQKTELEKHKLYDQTGDEVTITGKVQFKKLLSLTNVNELTFGEVSRTEKEVNTLSTKGTISGDWEFGEGSIKLYKHKNNPDYLAIKKLYQKSASPVLALLDVLGDTSTFRVATITKETLNNLDTSGNVEEVTYTLKFNSLPVERTRTNGAG